MKEKAILFIYGEGGHRAKMQRLFNYMEKELVMESDVKYISIYENGDLLDSINYDGYEMPTVRDKYSKFRTLINIFVKPYKIISTLFKIKRKYDTRIILSTGPGISILPIIFFKLFNTKTIHFETDSRFMTKSLSGQILYYLVDKFYVPNKSLLKLYKKSEFSGQL